ncbi:MAG: hypothetical protein K2H35_02600 [Muribaculaceae bacterium]|nr:hypothetical protein [Muribaculaceae bacterium]
MENSSLEGSQYSNASRHLTGLLFSAANIVKIIEFSALTPFFFIKFNDVGQFDNLLTDTNNDNNTIAIKIRLHLHFKDSCIYAY